MNFVRSQTRNFLSSREGHAAALGPLGRIRHAMSGRRFLRSPLVWNERLERTVQRSLNDESPLRVLLLWGKGSKREPDRAEERAAELLVRYKQAVDAAWPPGLQYSVLFADTHAAANGYEARESNQYFSAVRAFLNATCFSFNLLSEAWDFGGLNWDHVRRYTQSLDDPIWDKLEIRLPLASAAARHSRIGDPEQAARLYVAVRLLENKILSRLFDGYLYATSDAPERWLLCPDLPILHMYSIARGRCGKPWFMTMPHSDEFQAAEPANRCAV